MIYFRKQMAAALSLSTIFVIFNIIAITTGSATIFYSQLEAFISHIL
ncbi:MAG: hypothetical protein IMF14_01385 [Proteobacteria bacterium]|nr:hypothetical protein [Pseudomonadota bacterium]